MAANIAKRLSIVALAAAAGMAALAATGHAEEEGIDKAKADAFDVRMFASPPGKKAYACFVRPTTPSIWPSIPGRKSAP